MLSRLVVAAAWVLLAACTPGATPDEPVAPSATLPTIAPPPDVYPAAEWTRIKPRAAGFSPAKLAALDATLEASGSTCLAIIKDGELVHDAYWAGTNERSTRPAYSITKSATSVLVGMAIKDGKLALSDKASDHIPDWQGTPSANITVRDLLANVSGREWTYDLDYSQMIRRASNKTAFAIALGQQFAPGEHWEYNNSAVQTLQAVLESALGQDPGTYARERLTEPLGMNDTTWSVDDIGHITTYSGLHSSCLDMARLGLLMMCAGQWGDEQLISPAFVNKVTTPSSDLNAGYGLLWWVNQPGRIVEIQRAAGFPTDIAPYEGQLAPSVPKDAFWALGYGNQYVAVIPSEGIVAVRMGARPSTPDQVTFESFTSGVLDSQQ